LALLKAKELKCLSVSIPPISCGIYLFPIPLCAKIMIETIKMFLCMYINEPDFTLKFIRMAIIDVPVKTNGPSTISLFEKEFDEQFLPYFMTNY